MSKGGEGGVAASVEAGEGGGGGGAGGRKRSQRGNKIGGGSQVNGNNDGASVGTLTNGVGQSFHSYRGPPPGRHVSMKGRHFPVQGPSHHANGQRRWDGDKVIGFVSMAPRSGSERDPWTPPSGSPVPGSSLSPPHGAGTSGGLGSPDGRGIVMSPMPAPLTTTATPPLISTLPSLLGLPPDSSEYLGDLASALSSTSPAPSVASTLFGNKSIGPLHELQEREGAEEQVKAKNGTTSRFSMPKASTKATADIGPISDLSLDLDIQDICVDPDLNADAPAFVPGGYFPG